MFPRSFRARLTWFFFVIVVLPMIAVSVVLFHLVSDAERGVSDARLGLAETAAQGVFRTAEERAAATARRFARSPELAAAIARDGRRIDAALSALAERHRVSQVELDPASGQRRTYRGGRHPVAPATTTLVADDGTRAGTLRVSVLTATGLARTLADLTGMEAIVTGPDGGTLAATLRGVDARRLPARGALRIDGRSYRVTRPLTAPTWEARGRLTVRLLADQQGTEAAIRRGRLTVAAVLLGFLVLASAFAVALSRSLQEQIRHLLTAARRLGRGELHAEVPTEGSDEFAALGTELNSMARQLQSRMAELENERTRVAHAFRRVGESFAKNLDRDALLGIAVQTAVDGVAASVGRARIREASEGPLAERTRVGELDGYGPALDAVEAAALQGRRAAQLEDGVVYALSHPLGAEGFSRVLGLISVARRARPFSGAEQELFNYLASQASVSIGNVDLHESVQRQAITDGLTGLFNHRRFQEVMVSEVERSKRFKQPLGLVMLDLDDFKTVNDRYGHLQGDLVLREVARVLLESSREIDEPARYGGEEMAVALPQTDLEGSRQFAERVRRRIEALEVPKLEGVGTVRVTASFGAAALPDSSASDKDALVAAADSALYQAKHLGRNRVVTAG